MGGYAQSLETTLFTRSGSEVRVLYCPSLPSCDDRTVSFLYEELNQNRKTGEPSPMPTLSNLVARYPAYEGRLMSSTLTWSGASMKATVEPEGMVQGSQVKLTWLALSRATAASMSSTSKPKWSRP